MKYFKLALVLGLLGIAFRTFAQDSSGFSERVDFSVPKTIYFTGEKIWLSIQVETNAGPTPSRIVYAELWNRYQESVALAKIPLQVGESFNFLEIPDNLPSDQYLLRVFTRVSPQQDMENGLVQEFITVFNPRIPPEVVAKRPNEGGQISSSTLLSLSQKTVKPGEQITISYTGADSPMEFAVSVPNPFLAKPGKVSSNDLYESLPVRKSVPEFFGHIIEARIDPEALDAIGSGLYYLSLHGEKSVLFTDKLDSEGRLFFDAGGLRHWDFMVAQGREFQSMNDFEIVSPSPKTEFKSVFQFPPLQISPDDEPLLKELLKGSQLEGFFVQEFKSDPIPVVTGFVQDRTYILDDYNRFEDVETHLKEYVPEVLVRNRGNNKELRVLNEEQGMSFTKNPLLLVDAMPITDLDALLKFNPAKFEKMEILTRQFFLNEEIYSGVVSFSSFQNDFGGFPLPENAVYLPYPGIQPPVTEKTELFLPPSDQKELLDWRTILYWSPATEEQALSKSVTLTAPFLKGVFQVLVKTVDPAGKTKIEIGHFQVED